MPKTPSDRLYHLIKSLSGSEKRYFKIFVHTDNDKDNKYLRLFDAIDAQPAFDDEALCLQVYQGEPIQSRKYSELKAYLYDMLVRSLQSYDEKQAVDNRLRNLLLGVKSLYKRALFDDCFKVLQKAEKLAENYEKLDAQMEALHWHKQIAYARADIAYLDRQLDLIAAREAECLDLIRNLTDYQTLFYRVWVAVRKNAQRAGSQDEVLHEVSSHPLLTGPDQALTHQSRIFYYRIKTVLSYSAKDYQNFYLLGGELIALMETKPHFLREDLSEYISALSNYAVSCGFLGRYREVNDCLEKLRRITPITLDDKLKIHRQYYTHKFRLCIETGDFDEGLRVVENHLNELEQLDKDLFERSSFYFQYFYIFFGAGNYNRALDYLNQWLNLPRSIERQDLQSLSRVLNLIIHYEMGNYLLLESLLRSTYRYLNKQEGLLEFEIKLIHFIRQAGKSVDKKETRKALLALKTDFQQLLQKPKEKAMLQMFDFEAWLDSHLEGRSFAQLVKEKYIDKTST
ncbi:MAG: hypothetical protein HUU34_00535 [Saprospiraceae bacterium]|jgi:hypothetical protein|nr:hypothetical protein [Saprospiraceae bacterium]